MKYYSIKNPELGFFNKLFPASDDKEAMSNVRNALLFDRESRTADQLAGGELYRIGEFDTDRGRFSGKPELVIKISDIPLPGAPKAEKGGA